MKITMTALSPIVHGDFVDGIDTGNLMPFRRIPVQRSGKVYSIPVLSGNSTRGAIRRLLAREMIDRFDMRKALGREFDKFYIAIANGGNLDKNMDVAVDTDSLRTIRAMLPMLSVLGASLYKYMLSGMVNIGFALPRCTELETGTNSVIDLMADVGLTRHIEKEQADPADAKPMPYTVETVITGTEFDLNVDFAPQATEVEKACIMHGFNLLTAVGGKSAAGFGAVRIDHQDDAAYTEWLDNLTDEDVCQIISFARGL